MRILLFALLLFVRLATAAQSSDGPREFLPADEKKLQASIEKEVARMKPSVLKEAESPLLAEITLDTFRVERYLEGRMAIDYSTAGMRMASMEAAHRYDSLLNKYYRRLLQRLKPADRPVLVAAQKAWIGFRDAEMRLVGTMSKDEYSGGGTMQQLIDTDAWYQAVRARTLAIIDHLTRGEPQ